MKKYLIGLFVLIFLPIFLFAQDEPEEGEMMDTIDTSLDIFEDPIPMDITLTLDLKKYQREKFKGEYIPVSLLYHFNDSVIIEKEMRIKARGQFRREHCTFAPFWLNIRKADVENEHLQEVKRMKVVTHCRGSAGYANYVLQEYLIYKIYNILSPLSFRVRLIKMKYVDTGRKNRVTESWAFMIEPEDLLAERHNALAIKNDKLVMKWMEPGAMDMVALFQFMIGNSDYSIAGRHNVKILGLPEFGTKGYSPVPYDFDYTGFVDAYYAVPGENLGIASVKERYFLGPCREADQYHATLKHFEEHKEEIYELIQSFPYLEEKVKKSMITYLQSFYDLVANPKKIEFELNSSCR